MNWEQIKTVLWLRWRLICNQARRGRGVGIVISMLIGVAAGGFGVASFAGGFLGGFLGLSAASPAAIWLTWFIVTIVFLFFWFIGLVIELQRSETIDLQKLMHLPVALGPLFVINFLVSHFTLSIIIAVPAMLGLGLGLALGRSFEMALVIPLAAGMIFMISGWTYCFRGWLAQLMTNPRRRRTVIMCLTFSIILLGQGPNIYFNIFNRFDRHRGPMAVNLQRQYLDNILAVQPCIPPLWLPWGARALAQGRFTPALLGTLGCFAIGALGLRRAYRGTIRFYHGKIGGHAPAKIDIPGDKTIARPKPDGRVDLLERRLPYIPEQAGALALATFRSLLRAPEVKMAWGVAFIVPVILSATVLFRWVPLMPADVKPFAATGAAAFSMLMLIQFLCNQFGFDRDGFRALMLSPADRRLILLGKNLACLPLAVLPGLLMLAILSVPLRLPPLIVAATLLQLVTLFLIVGTAGNFISIMVPQRIAPGTLRPTKAKIEIVLLMIFLQFFFMAAMTPVFLPALSEWLCHRAGLPGFVPVNFLCSAALLAAIIILYWQMLGPLGRLLQRRETKILETVTAEVE
jgi:ABC-2 type transport system permease protein